MTDWLQQVNQKSRQGSQDNDLIRGLYDLEDNLSDGGFAMNGLTGHQEKTIRAWLGQIGETNPVEIAGTLQLCSEKPEARDYFLRRAAGEST